MADDRDRTLRLNMLILLPVLGLCIAMGWFLSTERGRVERLVRDNDARHQIQVAKSAARQQELTAQLDDVIETLRLKDLAYFPPDVFGKDDVRGDFIVRQLRALKVASLWALAGREDEGTTARLLWLPDAGRPTLVRLLPPDRRNSFSYLEVAQIAEPNPAGISAIIKGQIALRPEQSADLDRRLDEVGLWSAPATPQADPPGAPGVKGRWILEGVKEGRYHLLIGRSAADKTFQKISQVMLLYPKVIQDIRIAP